MKNTFKHQGDIPFRPFTGKAEGKLTKHNGSLILALGEHTGHKHVITVPDILDMTAYKTSDGGWILELKKEGVVTHNQHGQITLAPGKYKVDKEREFDWFSKATREVVD